MSDNTYLPNTFQTPNDYIDLIMEFLTGEEFKCLMFAVRHIYGWQDKIGSRRNRISFSMFEHGFETDEGKHFGGTGLARVAIQKAVDALDQYKILPKIGAPTAKGQEYEIGLKPDIDGLRLRALERLEQNRKRTSKARKMRPKKDEVSITNQVSSDSQTNQDVVSGTDYAKLDGLTSNKLDQLTDNGKSDLLKQTHSQTHSQTQEETHDDAPDGAASDLPVQPKPSKSKRKTPHEPEFDALAVANGHDPEVLKLNKTAASNYWSVASDLHKSKFPVERIPALFDYCKAKARHEGWSGLSVNVLGKYAPDFVRDNGVYTPPTANGSAPRPSPAAPPRAPSPGAPNLRSGERKAAVG